jgi:Copper binding proteins, plastocyanin/azurin family
MAVLLAAAVAAAPASASAARKRHRVSPPHRLAKQAPRHKGIALRRGTPVTLPGQPGPTPTPTATPTPTPTATPPPSYPSRTRVVLKEWSVTSSYIVMKAGALEFNVDNLGEDDHNLSIKNRDDTVAVPPGGSDTLTVTLAPGTYTLYCSLPGHEDAGMRTTLTVK